MELDSASLKFRRAQYHFNCLKAAYARLQKASLNKTPTHYKLNPGEEISLEPSRQPSARWGLIIGDCIQNLRSALDHAVFQVVPSADRRIYAEKINFPICSTTTIYDDWKGKNAKWVATVDGKAIRFIDQLQPCDGGNTYPRTHPLWVLHQLSNLDKHRRIHVAFAGFDSVSSEEGFVITHVEPQTRVLSLVASTPAEVKVHLNLTVQIVFQEGEDVADLPVFSTIGLIGKVVAGTINGLRPFMV